MKHFFTLILFFSFLSFGFSQSLNPIDNEKIHISEKKTGKRVVIFAENTTLDTLNVFLMVTSKGYRRSASKPVIKDILPLSKVPMITLIELVDEPSSYTYKLIVNDEPLDLHIQYEKNIEDIENLINGKLVLFIEEECDKCSLLETMLTSQRTNFQSFDIHKDKRMYQQFMKFISKRFPQKTSIRLPLIWNKSEVFFGYDNLETILKVLN
ncbi:MAG: hypothetical protein ACWA45_02050 [Flavobacteriales bacterium]